MNKLFEQYKITIEAILAASKTISTIYSTNFERVQKDDGSPVTQADLQSSKIIASYLQDTGIPINGEETEKTPYSGRKNWEKSWCVDPLDGTKEFIKKNGEFVINIALIEDKKAVFGIIASPIRQKIIIGGKGKGAFQMSYKNALQPQLWEELTPLKPPNNPLHIISSRSYNYYSKRLLQLAHYVEKNYGNYTTSSMGSALKFFELVNGNADIYPRFAPTMEWDIAAGQAIYEAIGGKIINATTGLPLLYNKADFHNPHFIALSPFIKIPLTIF